MTTITRLIEQDIYTNASTMVQDLIREGSHWSEDLFPCCSADDWETPVRDEVTNASYVTDLVTVADEVGTELTTHSGAVVDYDNASDYKLQDIDTAALLAVVDEVNAWQAVGELLDVDPEQQEALQHWLVSDYLAEELEAIGALIVRDVLGFNVWGRTECGQGLEHDSDLRKVALAIENRLAEMANT